VNFLAFKERMFELACFSIYQVLAWQPDFDRNNLTRWVKKGYLVKLRQGYYAFSEYKSKPDFAMYIANRIYKPSYISLHTALSFYGMIPEAVVQITSVTSLKTISFANDFGEYSYSTVKENLMFGYDLKPMSEGRSLQFARPEKALLDLLYLYPFYNSLQELEELRLDEGYMNDDLDVALFLDYTSRFKNTALEKRATLLLNIYGL